MQLEIGKHVRRSRWIKLLTPGRIIDIINAHAGNKTIKLLGDSNDDLPLPKEGGDVIRAEPPIETVVNEEQGVVAEPGLDPTIIPEESNEVISDDDEPKRGDVQVEEPMRQTQEVEKNNSEPETPVESEETEEELGRGKRLKRSSTWYGPRYGYAIKQIHEKEAKEGSKQTSPTCMTQLSVPKALRKHGRLAEDSLVDEFVQLFKTKRALVPVMKKYVQRKHLLNKIRSSMFLKEKVNGEGVFEKLKSRLVADGRGQDRAHYQGFNSPTATLEAIFLELQVASSKRRKWAKIDIGGAYLNAYLDEDDVIIMVIGKQISEILVRKLPELRQYLDEETGCIMVQILKAMYGLIQSASLWYNVLSTFLHSLGFKSNSYDNCVMKKETRNGTIIIILYVDDILVLSDSEEDIGWLKGELEKEYETLSIETSDSFTYLGMVLHKQKDGTIQVHMPGYIEMTLNEYQKMRTIKQYTSPATTTLFSINCDSVNLGTKEAKHYHTSVARLLYLCRRARIDIYLPVLYLCTKVKCPTEADAAKLDRVMGYLSLTKHKRRLIAGDGDMSRLYAFIDASFSVHDDGKGHTGMVIMWGNVAVAVVSKKQKIATKDSTEAELVALSDMIEKTEWAHEYLKEQGYDVKVPLIYEDNTSTITLVKKPDNPKLRTRHLTARRSVVYEHIIRYKSAEIEYKNTSEMLADTLTKPLVGSMFYKLNNIMMGWQKLFPLEKTIHHSETLKLRGCDGKMRQK